MQRTDDELIAWLKSDDAASRPYRLPRLKLLVESYGSEEFGRLFPGGPVSAIAFREARLAYLHGLFVSCIFVSQVCLEHTLHGLFKMEGRDDLDRATYRELLSEARRAGLLDLDEFGLFDRLRKERNPYAHPRSLDDDGSLVHRAIDSDISLDELIVDDARRAMLALMALTRRSPFALRDDRGN